MMSRVISYYESLSLTLKATFWFTICNFILKGISFITVPLFAAFLSTEEYGVMSIYYSYEQIFLIFATLELSIGAYQRGLLKYKENEKLFTSSVIILGNLITIVNLLIFGILHNWFISLTNISFSIFILMFAYFFVQPSYNAWLTKKRFSYEYKPAVIATLLYTILTTIISLLFVVFVSKTANTKISSFLIVEIVFCFLFYLKSIDIIAIIKNFKLVRVYWFYCLKFQLPLLFHSLSYIILSQSDRVMIGSFVNNSKAAIYSVAYNIASAVLIFQQSLNQVFKPWRYQKMETKEYDTINKVSTSITLLLAILISFFIVIAPDIIRILFREEYYEAVWTIPPVSTSVFFMFLYSMFSDIESYFSQTKYMAFISVLCAILNIMLNYFGIIYFGYIACAYTTLLTYIFFAIGHYYFMKKIIYANNISYKIYNTKLICSISLGILIFTIIVLFLYEYTILRYGFILISFIYCIINRNYFFKIIKTMKQS